AQPSRKSVRATPSIENAATSQQAAPAKVSTLHLDAAAANWDADVETDGIQLQVAPIGADGLIVPVSGTLEVELIGQGPGAIAQPETFPVLARWVRQLTPEAMGTGGYTWQLEYQAWHPEFNLQLGYSALVHARLVVPGSGAFEISSPTIAVRP